MANFKVGDKVKIIKRKKNNTTGTEPGWSEPNGNVGETGYIVKISKISNNNSNRVQKTMDSGYFGWFDEDDLELVSEEVSTTPYIKGKWYGCEHWIGEHNYIKLNYVSDEQAYFTECIDNEKHQVKQDWWAIGRFKLFEADMSVVSQFLPQGHSDKIDSKEFVLPKKWCIRLTEENVDVLGKWRSSGPLKDPKYATEGWYLHTPKYSANGYNEPSKDPNYTEITFEQFKQYVLKESPVVETPEKTKFQKGDYIVTLINDGECGKTNYCSKQRKDLEYLSPEIDTKGSVHNGNSNFDIADKSFTKWRYATPEEAAEYERIGKPYDVTTLQKKKEEYIPQVGDYVVMEKAGGWGYHPDNEGCIVIIENVSKYPVNRVKVLSISGQVINAKNKEHINFTNVPIIGYDKERVFRKALPHEIPSNLPKKTVIEEWEPGTYAVGIKGNFGIFNGSTYSIPVGHIYIIKENRTEELVVEGKEFWIYKNNLKWFATREEAETFSKGLRTGHITIESSEKVKPMSQLWMEDPIVEERINTPSIKKETFIENVQSVSVMLRTKKKSIKF